MSDEEDHILQQDLQYLMEKTFNRLHNIAEVPEDNPTDEEPTFGAPQQTADERAAEEVEKKRLLMKFMDEDQQERLSAFITSGLSKSEVKKIINNTLNQTVSQSILIFMCGVGKLFAMEIIERAIKVKERWYRGYMLNKFNEKKEIYREIKKLKKDRANKPKVLELQERLKAIDVHVEQYESSPLLPEHIKEAWRVYLLENEPMKGVNTQWRLQGERSGSMFR